MISLVWKIPGGRITESMDRNSWKMYILKNSRSGTQSVSQNDM